MMKNITSLLNARIILIFLFFHAKTGAQTNELQKILAFAEKNYPSIEASRANIEASKMNIALQKNSLMPQFDITYQANYATFNNIRGMYFPAGMIPVSGPASGEAGFEPVLGSAASAYLNWQPLTFGARKAQIELAEGEYAVETASLENKILELKVEIINTYLDVLLAQELIKIAEAYKSRSEYYYLRSVEMVKNGLVSGVDSAFFHSEYTKSKIQVLRSVHQLQILKTNMSNWFGRDTLKYSDTLFFNTLPSPAVSVKTYTPPSLLLADAQLNVLQLKKKTVVHSMYPKLSLWSVAYGRGSGVTQDGMIAEESGLAFSKYNFGVGLHLSIPILKYKEVRLQLQQQEYKIQSGENNVLTQQLEMSTAREKAELNLQNALLIVREIPTQYQAAEFAFHAIDSRYKSGLANYTELIQAQYNLQNAEIENRMAYWEVWKAFLYKAVIAGNLDLFLNPD